VGDVQEGVDHPNNTSGKERGENGNGGAHAEANIFRQAVKARKRGELHCKSEVLPRTIRLHGGDKSITPKQ